MELMEDDSLSKTLETENNKKLRIPGLTFNFSKEKIEELIKIFNFGEENMVDKKAIDRLTKEPNYLPDRLFENEEIQNILKLYQNNSSNEGIKYLKSMSEKSMKEINPELYKKINRIENNNEEKKLPIEYNKFIDLEAEKLIKLFNIKN
ncbi:hypothetical protein K502DRAFT_117158 [Neoconidiobolus thromboides FSU 785]|nr:hypothetical protein K502DRAFT_117158 [Neoconidiobolus thromboides FSU 785]